MSELISGKEALIALVMGGTVLIRFKDSDDEWIEKKYSDLICARSFAFDDQWEFCIKEESGIFYVSNGFLN